MSGADAESSLRRSVSIDAGQSSIRVRVFGSSPVEHVFPGVRNDRSTIAQIAELLAANGAWGGDSIAVGLTGFDDDRAAPSALLHAAPSARRVSVAHDSITGYLGANGDGFGVVAAVGTGVVVLGVGPGGVARVDGWGALLGDAGGAYWIGRAGLDAALRAHDGRGRPTQLAALAAAVFGDLHLLALAVQADADRVRRVAAFARTVTELAVSDEVAADIVDRAAAELAASIGVALERAQVAPEEARVTGTGRVFTATALVDRLAVHLAERIPLARFEPLLTPPMDGVERLHILPKLHPLSASVFTAER